MKYRIKKSNVIPAIENDRLSYRFHYGFAVYSVQVKRWFGWVTVKEFCDTLDEEFAKLEAEELLELLEQ